MMDIETMDNSLATKKVVNAISQRMDGFADIEHIKYIKEVLLPRIEDFSGQVLDLLADNGRVKECIRKFDIAISIKASKQDLKTTKAELEKRFIHQDEWKDLLVEFDDREERLK